MVAAPMVRVEELTRRFRDVVAVESLTFEVRRGELFGLVGPDGTGKTTTLRMLAGVLRPSSGDAIVNGISVVRDPEGVKSRIAYMSQRFGLYADLTVLENLEFYADLYQVAHAERPARLDRLFRFSNLEPFQHRRAGQLSGGMKQKLGLSCALIHQPDLLLLDEPTFGVDPISRRDLWLIIHEMVGRGVTVVVSTAYMDEAERFDRLALLHRGRILALDAPDALRAALRDEMVAISVERLHDAKAYLDTHGTVRRTAIFGDALHVTVASAVSEGPTIASTLRHGGFTVSEVRAIAPSLEDAFIERIAEAEEA